jgi:histidinol-phosphate aminotransferase
LKPIRELMQPHIVRLKGYEFEDPLEVQARKLGLAPEDVLRVNLNENPYGPSPKVLEALARYDEYNRYPDPLQREARAWLSDYVDIGVEYIVAGSGADELIDLSLRIFLNPGERTIVLPPTFGMYAFNTGVCGGEVIRVQRDASFDVDVKAVKKVAKDAKILFLTSPNNPTGNVTSADKVRRVLETGLIVIVDETYTEFCGVTVIPLVREYPNLIVLRSFSKWAGLAGLRVGFGVMNPAVVERMLTMKPPYNLSKAAELAMKASLEDREFLMGRVRSIVTERERLYEGMRRIPGLKPWPSKANFVLCQLPEGHGSRVRDTLLKRGIFIRYYSDPRLRDYIRITAGVPEHTDRVLSALREVLQEAK